MNIVMGSHETWPLFYAYNCGSQFSVHNNHLGMVLFIIYLFDNADFDSKVQESIF